MFNGSASHGGTGSRQKSLWQALQGQRGGRSAWENQGRWEERPLGWQTPKAGARPLRSPPSHQGQGLLLSGGCAGSSWCAAEAGTMLPPGQEQLPAGKNRSGSHCPVRLGPGELGQPLGTSPAQLGLRFPAGEGHAPPTQELSPGPHWPQFGFGFQPLRPHLLPPTAPTAPSPSSSWLPTGDGVAGEGQQGP